MAEKKNSGQYTIFDENSWYFNEPKNTGSVSKHDLSMYSVNYLMQNNPNINVAIKKGANDATVFKLLNDTGKKIATAKLTPDGTLAVTNKKGKTKTVDPVTGAKVKSNPITQIARLFSGAKGSGKKSVIEKQIDALQKTGLKGAIKFTPSGKTPYITQAGTYMGQPGQWVTWANSKGSNTITAFNPASGAPPSNFYGNTPSMV